MYKKLLIITSFIIFVGIIKFTDVSSANELIQNDYIEDGLYTIHSKLDNNLLMDISGDAMYDTANVEVWCNNDGNNQKFYIKNMGDNYYTIQCYNSNKYLDVAYGAKNNGANVQQYEYNGGENQKWLIKRDKDGYYNIISKCNGLNLDVKGGIAKSGTNILTWVSNGGENQKFLIKKESEHKLKSGVYTITSSIDESYVLDVMSDSRLNGTNIELWSNNGGNNQKYEIKELENNCFSIKCVSSDKYVDVYGGYKYNGTKVIQYGYNGNENQQWIIKYAGNGYYNIISKCNNLYLDVANSEMKNGTNILCWSYTSGNNQKFKFNMTKQNETVDEGRSANFKKEHPDIKVGIDVSKYQGKIDWNLVKKDGIDFVMLRAGFRGYGQSGSLNEDSMFDEYIQGAKSAGLDVGVYFFSQAKNEDEGIKEAEYTIELIKKYNITYPVALDTEYSSSPNQNGRADNISIQERTDAIKGFCKTITNNGYKTLIYASPWWIKNKIDINQLAEYKIWLANYTGATQEDPLKKPSEYKGKYVMWQYTDCGTVNGINTNVDCDIYYYQEQ